MNTATSEYGTISYPGRDSSPHFKGSYALATQDRLHADCAASVNILRHAKFSWPASFIALYLVLF